MTNLVLKFLFWPWFVSQGHYSVEAISIEKELIFVVVVLSAIISARFLIRWWIKSGAWPTFLQKSIFILYSLADVGILGRINNLIAEIYYEAKMPVMTEAPGMIGMQLDARHIFAEPNPLIFWLGNYLKIRDSRLLIFLFPQREYASIGDIFIAACIIFSWWAALIITCWAIQYAYRKIFVKTPTEF